MAKCWWGPNLSMTLESHYRSYKAGWSRRGWERYFPDVRVGGSGVPKVREYRRKKKSGVDGIDL